MDRERGSIGKNFVIAFLCLCLYHALSCTKTTTPDLYNGMIALINVFFIEGSEAELISVVGIVINGRIIQAVRLSSDVLFQDKTISGIR